MNLKRTKLCLDLDTGKLTLPKGYWEIVVTGGGSATVNTMTVNNEPEDVAIADLHRTETTHG